MSSPSTHSSGRSLLPSNFSKAAQRIRTRPHWHPIQSNAQTTFRRISSSPCSAAQPDAGTAYVPSITMETCSRFDAVQGQRPARRSIQLYRPISVTCCLGKLGERVVHYRIYTTIEGRGFFVSLNVRQLVRRRTTDYLFYLSQKVKENMCRGKHVC